MLRNAFKIEKNTCKFCERVQKNLENDKRSLLLSTTQSVPQEELRPHLTYESAKVET